MAEQRPRPSTAEERRVAEAADAALQRLTKWRSVFAGWQLGTRTKDDPESQAVRDHRELSMLLRVELTALVGLLIDKGVFTAFEFTERIGREADLLSADFERRFPGMSATDAGIAYDLDEIRKRGTMRGWRP